MTTDPGDMGIDHGSGDIGVSEQCLYGSDICTGLQQVSGKGVSHGMAGYPFVDPDLFRGLFDATLNDRLMYMVSAYRARAGILRNSAGGKEILPT